MEKASEFLDRALIDIGFKELIIKKFVPLRYFLIQYDPSWINKALEIEFMIKKFKGVELSMK